MTIPSMIKAQLFVKASIVVVYFVITSNSLDFTVLTKTPSGRAKDHGIGLNE